MGLAIKDKYYGDGYTYLGTRGHYNLVKTGVKFDDSSKSFEDNYTGIKNLYSLVESGIYFTDLEYLLNTKGFANFLHIDGNGLSNSGIILGLDENVPVLIYVDLYKDINKVNGIVGAGNMVNPEQEIGYLAKMSGADVKDSYFPGREAIYKTLSGVSIPEIPSTVLKDITYACADSWDYVTVKDIGSLDLNNDKVSYLLYKGIPVSFYRFKGAIDMYVGGYGFEFRYPNGYVAMTLKDKPRDVIDIYAYEQPTLCNMAYIKPAELSGHVRNNLGYLFDIYGTKFTDGKTYALYFPKEDGNIDYSSEYPTTVHSFDLPYNPNVYTAIGKMPFTDTIYLKGIVDFNNVGSAERDISIDKIGIGSGKYLPHGLYDIDNNDYTKFINIPFDDKGSINEVYYLEDKYVEVANGSYHSQKLVININIGAPDRYNCFTRFYEPKFAQYSAWYGSNIV